MNNLPAITESAFDQYRKLTGVAMRQLKAGLTEYEVLKKLTPSS